jgi:hypothetical protein
MSSVDVEERSDDDKVMSSAMRLSLLVELCPGGSVEDEGHMRTSYQNFPSPKPEQRSMPNGHISATNFIVELLFCGVGRVEL